jgi:hypothetical protein
MVLGAWTGSGWSMTRHWLPTRLSLAGGRIDASISSALSRWLSPPLPKPFFAPLHVVTLPALDDVTRLTRRHCGRQS